MPSASVPTPSLGTDNGAEPSPSPPPQQPTAITPGPRATHFLSLYNGALKTTLKTISYDNFAACFPTPATKVPDRLRVMHRGLVERLEGFANVSLALGCVVACEKVRRLWIVEAKRLGGEEMVEGR